MHVPRAPEPKEQFEPVAPEERKCSYTDAEFRKELEKLDPKMVDTIIQTVLDTGPGIKWEDIQGLEAIK